MLTAVRSPRAQLPRSAAFALAAVSMVAATAASGVPAPLYVVYQDLYGVSAAGLTGAFAIYILPLATMLLVCGRLSDHLGRRTVAGPALVLAALACLILTQVDSTGLLMVGRTVQGLAVGLALTALGAFVVDLGPPDRPGVAAAVVSGAPTGGVALGALFSGAVVEFGPHPTVLVYLVGAAILLACAVGILFAPETSPRSAGAVRSLRPVVRVSAGARPVFVAVCFCIVASFGLGGFSQALSPSLAAQVLGRPDHLSGGLVVAALHVTCPVAGVLAGRWRAHVAMVGGSATLIVAVVGIAVAVEIGTFGGFVAACLVAGLGFGSAFVGAMRTVLDGRTPDERAGTLAAVYLVCYLGAAIPSFLAGVAVGIWGLRLVSQGFCALIILLAAAGVARVLIQRARDRPRSTGVPHPPEPTRS